MRSWYALARLALAGSLAVSCAGESRAGGLIPIQFNQNGPFIVATDGSVTYDASTGDFNVQATGAGTALTHANGFDVSASPFVITQGSLAINDGNDGNNYSITYDSADLTLAQKTLTDSGYTCE